MHISKIVKVIVLLVNLAILAGCGNNENLPIETLSVANQKPNAVISPTIDQTIIVGESISFSANTSSNPDSITPLSYQWNFIGAATSIQSSTDAVPGQVFFLEIGTVIVSLVVTDNLGVDSDPVSITVNVVAEGTNLAPNGSISHDNGDGSVGSTGDLGITTGADVVFSGSGTDPENDTLSFAWSIPGNVTTKSIPGSTPFTANFAIAGTYIIALTVTDSNGNVDTTPAQVAVTVTDAVVNLPPDGSISHDNGDGTTGSTGDINILAGTTIEFSGSAIDSEGDAVSYSWIFEGATPSTITSATPVNVSYPTAGIFLVQMTASDINGNTDLTPASLTVNVKQVLPEFQFLPVLSDEDGDPNDGAATYNLTVEDNVDVSVVTPTASWTTPMMRYNGLQLPPVIVAKRGTQMTINVQNNLAEETTVHWHGFQVPGDQDGGPNFPIIASASRTYNFALVQPAGPLWFHPHAHGTTATQVYNGLAGGLVITDEISQNLETNNQIPSGNYDIPLLIQDRLFAPDNGAGVRTLIYQAGGGGMMGGMGMAGMLGDHVLVNGVEMPSLKVDTHQYRFRIYNGSNARTYDFALDNNAVFSVVATDGGLLDAPVVVDHILLGAGERAEIVVDFGPYVPGDSIMLVSRAFAVGMMGGGGGALPNGTAFDVMRFDVDTKVTDDVVLYTSLPTSADINSRLTAIDADTTRNFVMSMGMGPGGMQFLINGLSFDMNRVDEVVPSGATEIWNVSNTSGMAHPFHAHAIQWQVLDRNGIPASGVDLGWKDTVLVEAGENVRLIGHFDPVVNKGLYMYHCHILEHEEDGMMGTFEVQ